MSGTAPTRTLRADALRSRARLLDVAAAAFAAGEEPTFKQIAAAAQVGIGTLYRHFPTREALVEAVYRAELDRLCARAAEHLLHLAPDRALRTWMQDWSDFVRTKRGMGDVLQQLAASGTVTKTETGERLTAAVASILDAGRATETLRGDVAAEDVIALLTGILLATAAGRQQEQAHRLLDLTFDGLVVLTRGNAHGNDLVDGSRTTTCPRVR